MNSLFNDTTPRILGATVYALNRTHGLAPAQERGELETVTEVLNAHTGLVKTDKGNVYSNGDFGIMKLERIA